MSKTTHLNYHSGSKIIKIFDEIENINFKTWILYPSLSEPQPTKIGSYQMNLCPDGKIANGKHSLVIISHGGGGSHLLYRTIAEYLAQNGYIVAMPEHYGNNRINNHLSKENKNITLRTRHISCVIDVLLSDSEFKKNINQQQIFMVGHSMGGCTALALAGAIPWSKEQKKITTIYDKRIKALVLLAPATVWFQHPDSFNLVNIPIMIFAAEYDSITPFWQSELIKQKVKNQALVTLKTIKNAGHLSFLAPFPKRLQNKNFAPSQDPDGFDREAFHKILKIDIFDFFEGLSQ